MSLIVQKFGGSSVRDRTHLLRAMEIVKRAWEAGDEVIAVLSAQGDTTDELLARAHELTDDVPPRELDALLATGETASVALGSIAHRSFRNKCVHRSAAACGRSGAPSRLFRAPFRQQ